jgi:hypothetical protein
MESMMAGAAQLQQQQIAMQTQVSLMKTSLNTQKAVGEAIISLIDTAASGFGVGSDARQGKSLTSGKNLDITG